MKKNRKKVQSLSLLICFIITILPMNVEAAHFAHSHTNSCYGNVLAECSSTHSSGSRNEGTTAHCGRCNASTAHTMTVYWDHCYGTGDDFELGGKRVCGKCGGTSYSWGSTSSSGKHQVMQNKIVCGKGTNATGRLWLENTRIDWTKEDVLLKTGVEILNQELIIDPVPYSWDGQQTWTADSEKIVTENGTYFVSARNTAGQIVSESVTVTNIDRNPPALVAAKKSSEEWITDDILIELQVQDIQEDGSMGCGLAEQYLSFDNGITWTDENKFQVVENGDYEIWMQDLLGNIGQTTVAVKNIDKLQPTILEVAQVEEGWQKQQVTMRIMAEDGAGGSGLAEYAYSIDGENWQQDPEFVFGTNGNHSAFVKDSAGNITSQEFGVNAIDVTAPKIINLREDTSRTEKDRVYLIIEAEDLQEDGSAGCGLHGDAYSLDGGETWVSDSGFWLSKGQIVSIKVRDVLENASIEEKEVTREDFPYVPPKQEEPQKPQTIPTPMPSQEPVETSEDVVVKKENAKEVSTEKTTEEPAIIEPKSSRKQMTQKAQITMTEPEEVEVKTMEPVKWYKTRVAKATIAVSAIVLFAGGIGALLWIFLIRARVYCYDGKNSYKKLGSVLLQKEENGYLIYLPEFMLEQSETTQYRIYLSHLMTKTRENAPLLVESSEKKVELAIQECIDFVL